MKKMVYYISYLTCSFFHIVEKLIFAPCLQNGSKALLRTDTISHFLGLLLNNDDSTDEIMV